MYLLRLFSLFLFLFFITNCNNNSTIKIESNKSNNLLVENNVYVSTLFSDSVLNETPWKPPIYIRKLISDLFYQFLKNNLTLYDPIFEDTTFYVLEKDSWIKLLQNNKNQIFDTSQFNDMYFFETWSLDTINTLNFQKKLIYWSPVKTEKERNVKKLVCKVKCDNNSTKKLLAKHVIYEFPFENSFTPNFLLNKNRLIRLIIDKSLSGNIKVYNPFTAKEMNKKELKQRLGISDSTLYMPYTSYGSILFIENWYYNPDNFSISKDVIGIAPVKYNFKEEELTKVIPFVIFMKEKPFILL